jgi:hypothetical protein
LAPSNAVLVFAGAVLAPSNAVLVIVGGVLVAVNTSLAAANYEISNISVQIGNAVVKQTLFTT